MRVTQIVKGEYYHLYARGAVKQLLFKDKKDYARMLFLILHLQSPISFLNTKRNVETFNKNTGFDVDKKTLEEIAEKRNVELVNFCIMPNHFHLTIKNIKEGGIPRYMQRIQLAYAKYFNEKYEASGHVFQGSYGAKRIKSDEQLLYLSTYVHKNPLEIKGLKGGIVNYTWSSLVDYVKDNRWGDLLVPNIVSDQFKSGAEYLKFVKSSSAKEYEKEFKI